MKSEYKRYSLVGHGGFGCSCCAPKSGTKYGARAIDILKRQAKRRFHKRLDKEQRVDQEMIYPT